VRCKYPKEAMEEKGFNLEKCFQLARTAERNKKQPAQSRMLKQNATIGEKF